MSWAPVIGWHEASLSNDSGVPASDDIRTCQKLISIYVRW